MFKGGETLSTITIYWINFSILTSLVLFIRLEHGDIHCLTLIGLVLRPYIHCRYKFFEYKFETFLNSIYAKTNSIYFIPEINLYVNKKINSLNLQVLKIVVFMRFSIN